MKITTNFDADEFGQALTAQGMQNYYLLCLLVLEKIRNRFGVVQITSGFRNEIENKRVGGSPTSQHLWAEAVDFVCPYAQSMGEVFRFILDDLQWPGETIWYKRRGHVHVSLPHIGVKADQYIDGTK